MKNFSKISQALHYIDDNLDDDLSYEIVAETFHFSPFYFHHIFSAIVGKTITMFIRERRLEKACRMLSNTSEPITTICFACGFNSSQSFCRTFKSYYGMSPNAFRKCGYIPDIVSVEEMIKKFANRLKGGILVSPNIVKKGKLLVAGITGNGNETGKLWSEFSKVKDKIDNKVSENGYEIRLFGEEINTCHVGVSVKDDNTKELTCLMLPASLYASFDVYISKGYTSENDAINRWLTDNKDYYERSLLDGKSYVVESYDERFNEGNDESIVEVWIPITKKN